MSTVGYGDITPKTLPGRVLAFLLSIWGVFIISLVVLIFFNFMQLDDDETMSLKVYDRLTYRDDMIKEAAKMVTRMAKIKNVYRTKPTPEVKKLAPQFKRIVEDFRKTCE